MPASILTADCARCCALCCVAHAFVRSPEFAFSKEADAPCPNLDAGFRCVVHAELARAGLPGCSAYDCLGAGQHVTQVLFGGRSWAELDDPAPMLAAFRVVRALFEQLSLLKTALSVEAPRPLRSRLGARAARLRALASGTLAELLAIDVARERDATRGVLRALAPHVGGELRRGWSARPEAAPGRQVRREVVR